MEKANSNLLFSMICALQMLLQWSPPCCSSNLSFTECGAELWLCFVFLWASAVKNKRVFPNSRAEYHSSVLVGSWGRSLAAGLLVLTGPEGKPAASLWVRWSNATRQIHHEVILRDSICCSSTRLTDKSEHKVTEKDPNRSSECSSNWIRWKCVWPWEKERALLTHTCRDEASHPLKLQSFRLII